MINQCPMSLNPIERFSATSNHTSSNAASDANVVAKPYDWNLLFAGAGFDTSRFTPARLREISPVAVAT
jgi:hypothetical protein